MYHVLRHSRGRRRAALTLLLGALAAAPAHASDGAGLLPPLFSSLLSVPQTFAAAWTTPTLPGLLSPPLLTFTQSSPASAWETPLDPAFSTVASLPSLASPWHALRPSDASLSLSSWRRVFNVARLGVFVLPLRDDPGERTNILLAAQAVDDATVAPGAVFSFNETVGERTPERGYQDGLMYSEGQLIRGTGGGICLVATGLYNAALQAGLPLLERHAHSGLVGYAPPGCDASIVYGAEDMRFQNTTGAPLIVKTEARDDGVVVSLYGKTPPPGHKVFVKATHLAFIHAPVITQVDPALPPASPPVVTQKPRMGFDVTVERFFKVGPRLVRREIIVSERRAPRPKIVHLPVPPPAPTAPAVGADGAFSAFGPPSMDTPEAFAAGRERGQSQEAVPSHDTPTAPREAAPALRKPPVPPLLGSEGASSAP